MNEVIASPEALTQNTLLFYCGVIFLFLLISAFFSAAETSLTAMSRSRLYQLVMEGNKRAGIISHLRKEKESMIGAILLGNNLVNSASAAIVTAITLGIFGESGQGLAIATLIVAMLIVIFTEILPKTYAIQNSERTALFIAPVLSVVVMVLNPITRTIQCGIRLLFKIFGIDVTSANTLVSATDVVRGVVELHHREGRMIKQDRDMLGSILDLNDIEVRNIMIHRKQVDTLNADLSPEELIQEAVGMLHSRVPLWRDNPDNIIGILHVKDLVHALNIKKGTLSTTEIVATAHKPWFIPETTSLRDQLLAFRARRQHFALVVDEYGALLGIVTLEDIIEEIVGNIEDEHDEKASGVHRVAEGVYVVDGAVTIRDLNRQLDWHLPDEDASTVAGLLMHEARIIPAKGQQVELSGYTFTVLEKDAAQITRLRIEKHADDASKEETVA